MSKANRPPEGHRTRRRYADPASEESVTVPDASWVPGTREGAAPPDGEGTEATITTLPPFVEVELVYERAQLGMRHETWRALEIWTRNRIYVCDWGMTCIDVIDRRTNEPDPNHPLLGAHLAGGQKSTDDHMEMTYPCPRPGTEAVFEYLPPRRGFVNTSTVMRVVLRLRVLTVPHELVEPSWDRLTGSFRLPE